MNYISIKLLNKAFLMAQMVKSLPVMQETPVQSLGWEDPLEKGMPIHSNILAWRIPRTEEPGAVYGVAQSRTQLKRLSSSSLKGEKSEQRHRTVFEFEGKMLPYAWRTSSSCRREQGHQCRSRASQADHDKPAGQGHTWITHITWIS